MALIEKGVGVGEEKPGGAPDIHGISIWKINEVKKIKMKENITWGSGTTY